MSNKLQLRRDTAANWEAANPPVVLAQGEIGLILDDNGKTIGQKIGDGVTEWKELEDRNPENNILNQYISKKGKITKRWEKFIEFDLVEGYQYAITILSGKEYIYLKDEDFVVSIIDRQIAKSKININLTQLK